MTPRIYVACLAAYNNAKLHGRWIEVEGKDPSDLQAEIDAMLKASPEPNAEEYAIHDTEDLPGIGENSNLKKVCAVAGLVAEHGELGIAVLKYHSGNVKYATDSLENYQGTFDSLEDYVESFLDDTGFFAEVPEHFRSYFDFEAYARDLDCNGDVYTIEVPGGIAVFTSR